MSRERMAATRVVGRMVSGATNSMTKCRMPYMRLWPRVRMQAIMDRGPRMASSLRTSGLRWSSAPTYITTMNRAVGSVPRVKRLTM